TIDHVLLVLHVLEIPLSSLTTGCPRYLPRIKTYMDARERGERELAIDGKKLRAARHRKGETAEFVAKWAHVLADDIEYLEDGTGETVPMYAFLRLLRYYHGGDAPEAIASYLVVR